MVRKNRGGERADGTHPPEDSDERFHAVLETHYRADDPWRYLPARAPQPEPGRAADSILPAVFPEPSVRRRLAAVLRSLPRAVWTATGGRPVVLAGGRAAVVLVVAAILTTGAVFAATTVFNLGKPTNTVSTNPHFPLSGFHYVAGLQPRGKARVLFIGTLSQRDIHSAPERWPLVKALQQFGSFSHLRALDHVCTANAQARRDLCTVPTFDWSHAGYRSPYLSFDEKELVRDVRGLPAPYQRMTATELTIYKRFTHVTPTLTVHYDPYNTAIAIGREELPLVVVGNYVEGPSEILHIGDFQEEVPPGGPQPSPLPGSAGGPTYPSGLSFAQIQKALRTQTDPSATTLVEDVNAETNIVTALVCRADGKKPSTVCRRPIIASILRHMR